MAMSRLEWIKKIIMMVVIRVILGGKFMSEWNAALYDNKHDFIMAQLSRQKFDVFIMN